MTNIKIISIIRFCVVVYMIYKITMTTILEWSSWDNIEVVVNIIIDFLTGSFVIYSIIESLNDFKSTVNDDIRFLRIFGLVFQFFILIGGILTFLTWDFHVSWRVIPPLLFLVGFLILIIVDIKKLRRQT